MGALMGIATNHNGYITSARVTAADIPRRKLTEAVRGELVQVDRGLYASPSAWEDPLCIANHRFSRGIFSDDTALFLHGMTDRAPFSPTMTFPRSYNATTTKTAGIACHTCADDVPSLGLCDIVRGHGTPDIQLTTLAMKPYVQSEGYNLMKLVACTRNLGVETKTRNYLEVLP